MKATKQVMERMAAVQHEIWAHWMRYLFTRGEYDKEAGTFVIDAESVKRWTEQMHTPYQFLSEKEKESDREQVRKFASEFRTIIKVVDNALYTIARPKQ